MAIVRAKSANDWRYAIDWDDPESNEFLIVNQLSVHGENDRRPDIVIYVNGLPLVLFELKNPYDEHPTAAAHRALAQALAGR